MSNHKIGLGTVALALLGVSVAGGATAWAIKSSIPQVKFMEVTYKTNVERRVYD